MSRPPAPQRSSHAGYGQRSAPRVARAQISDGPSTILLLFGLALLLGLLIGLAARWAENGQNRESGLFSVMNDGSAERSRAAALGYADEHGLEADNERADLALREVLTSPAGTQRLWENMETGNRGVIWAAEDQSQPGGGVCRALQRRAVVNGVYRNSAATVCRDAHSVWQSTVRWHTT